MIKKKLLLICLLILSNICYSEPNVEAKSYILYDYNANQYLYGENENKKLYPASLTKIMTAYVVLKQIKEKKINLKDEVLISKKAWKTGGSRSFVEVDTKVSVENLLKGMIVQSGNDASIALAEYIAESTTNFSNLMNSYAKNIGMENSNFVNPTGLHNKQHYTTAKDLSILAKAIMDEFPEYFYMFSLKSFTYNNITQSNRNELLFKDDKITGMKTGWTVPAGYCYIGTADFNGKIFISVILGAPTPEKRFQGAMEMLKYANLFFKQIILSDESNHITSLKVYGGVEDFVNIKTTKPSIYSLQIKDEKNIKAIINIKKHLNAPVKKGEVVGEIIYLLNGKEIEKIKLITTKNVDKGGVIKRIVDYIKKP